MLNENTHLRKIYNKYYKKNIIEENGKSFRIIHMNTINSESEHSDFKSNQKGSVLPSSEEKNYSKSFFINPQSASKRSRFLKESSPFLLESDSKSVRSSVSSHKNDFVNTSNSTQMLVKDIGARISSLKRQLTESFKIDLVRFRKLSSNVKLRIFSFLGDDTKVLMKTHKDLRLDIIEILKTKIIRYIISNFNQIYKDAFELVDKKIILTLNKNLKVDLVMKIRITLPRRLIGKTLALSNKVEYNYSYTNSYIFDYKDKEIPRKIWVMREYTKFHSNEYDKSFTQSILEFSHLDIMEISVNILSGIGLLQFETFQWLPLTYNSLDTQKENVRICELELIKSKWTRVESKNFKDYYNFLTKSIYNLEIYFDNICIYEEKIGFTIIKIMARAIKEGKINTKLGIDINIVGRNTPVTNEVKKSGLILDLFNYISLRVGDEITIYLSYSLNLFKF